MGVLKYGRLRGVVEIERVKGEEGNKWWLKVMGDCEKVGMDDFRM